LEYYHGKSIVSARKSEVKIMGVYKSEDVDDYTINKSSNSNNNTRSLEDVRNYSSTSAPSSSLSSSTNSKIHKQNITEKQNKNKNIKQIFILSFDALRERKARSALTILMVVVGSALMVALNGMSAGQNTFINKQMSMLAPNVIFVSSGQHGFRGGPQGPPTIVLNSEVVNRIKSLPFVQEVVPSYQGQLQLNAQGNILNSQIIAMDPKKIYLVTPSLELEDGSSIQSNNPTAMLVGDSIANPPGKTTPFVTIGQTVKGTFSYVEQNTGKTKEESKSFVISGIIKPTGNNFIDRSVIINEATGNSLFHKSGKYDQMVVAALSGDYVNTVQQEIIGLYGNNIGVTTPKAILQTRQQFQSGNSAFTIAIAFIALLVGAVGIITTLYTSVTERTKEIGTMKAIGAKGRFILVLFLSEALLIGIIGSTLGLLSGMGGSYILSSGFAPRGSGTGGGAGGGPPGAAPPHINPIFTPNDLFSVWILSLLLSIAAGIFPAWKASRLSPIEALAR
jgi:putative ABC transport system permease protein